MAISPPPEAVQKPLFSTLPETLGEAYQALAKALPGFEVRPEQQALTANIIKAVDNGFHFIGEAPTGTGKSFAAALALLVSVAGQGKAIVATANNNLLEQYAKKDFPFLQTVFPFKFARAKGKANYACIDKAEEVFGQRVLFDNKQMEQLKQWYDVTKTGDKDSIAFQFQSADWESIAVDDSCTGRQCRFYEDCHYYKAKRQLKEADIIVTNFDIVLIDLINPMVELLPAFSTLVIDEAHQLEDKTINKLEHSFNEQTFINLLTRSEKKYKVPAQRLADVQQKSNDFFKLCQGYMASNNDKVSIKPSEDLRAKAFDLETSLKFLRVDVASFKTDKPRDGQAQLRFMERITELGSSITQAVINDERRVTWVEIEKKRGQEFIKVTNAPFRVQGTLYNVLFNEAHPWRTVCLSATISAGGKPEKKTATLPDGTQQIITSPVFQTFMQKVGIPRAIEFQCPSPFDYANNCGLYVGCSPIKEEQNPNTQEYKAWFRQHTLDLVMLSRGRALVLTTATKAAKEVAEFLAATLPPEYPCRVQSPQASNSSLVEWFKKTPNAVLVGTASFWEGISVEGDDLKLVVIDKIPFPNHLDPIQQARDAWYNADASRKGKAFLDLQLYPAIIKLKQGFGRLIRTKNDTGVVAILDPRLTLSRYGGQILRALPPATRLKTLDDPNFLRLLT